MKEVGIVGAIIALIVGVLGFKVLKSKGAGTGSMQPGSNSPPPAKSNFGCGCGA